MQDEREVSTAKAVSDTQRCDAADDAVVAEVEAFQVDVDKNVGGVDTVNLFHLLSNKRWGFRLPIVPYLLDVSAASNVDPNYLNPRSIGRYISKVHPLDSLTSETFGPWYMPPSCDPGNDLNESDGSQPQTTEDQASGEYDTQGEPASLNSTQSTSILAISSTATDTTCPIPFTQLSSDFTRGAAPTLKPPREVPVNVVTAAGQQPCVAGANCNLYAVPVDVVPAPVKYTLAAATDCNLYAGRCVPVNVVSTSGYKPLVGIAGSGPDVPANVVSPVGQQPPVAGADCNLYARPDPAVPINIAPAIGQQPLVTGAGCDLYVRPTVPVNVIPAVGQHPLVACAGFDVYARSDVPINVIPAAAVQPLVASADNVRLFVNDNDEVKTLKEQLRVALQRNKELAEVVERKCSDQSTEGIELRTRKVAHYEFLEKELLENLRRDQQGLKELRAGKRREEELRLKELRQGKLHQGKQHGEDLQKMRRKEQRQESVRTKMLRDKDLRVEELSVEKLREQNKQREDLRRDKLLRQHTKMKARKEMQREKERSEVIEKQSDQRKYQRSGRQEQHLKKERTRVPTERQVHTGHAHEEKLRQRDTEAKVSDAAQRPLREEAINDAIAAQIKQMLKEGGQIDNESCKRRIADMIKEYEEEMHKAVTEGQRDKNKELLVKLYAAKKIHERLCADLDSDKYPERKSEHQLERQPERQPGRQPEMHLEGQPEHRPELQPERKLERQPEMHMERQQQWHPERQPERQPEKHLEHQPERSPEWQPEHQPEMHMERQLQWQPEHQPECQPEMHLEHPSGRQANHHALQQTTSIANVPAAVPIPSRAELEMQLRMTGMINERVGDFQQQATNQMIPEFYEEEYDEEECDEEESYYLRPDITGAPQMSSSEIHEGWLENARNMALAFKNAPPADEFPLIDIQLDPLCDDIPDDISTISYPYS